MFYLNKELKKLLKKSEKVVDKHFQVLSLIHICKVDFKQTIIIMTSNAGAQAIIAVSYTHLDVYKRQLLERLKAYSQELKEQVEAKDARLQEVGYKNY